MNKDANLGKRITRGVIALIGGVALALVGSTAFAGTEFGGGVGTDGGGGGTSNPGTGGGGGNSGGGTTNPPPTNYVFATFTREGNIATNCPASAIGYRISYRSTTDYFASNNALWNYVAHGAELDILPDYVEFRGISCIYPPSHRDVTVRVVLDANIAIQQVQPEEKTLRTASATTRWGNGERTLAAAYDSDSAQAAVSTSITEFGRYQLAGTARAQYVTIRTYSSNTDQFGNTYEDEVINTGAIFNASVTNARGQLDCANGWSNDWLPGSWNYEYADCAPTSTTNTPAYQCVADDGPAVTINGEARTSAALFRNGEANPVTFAAVRPSGLSNLHAERTRWTRNEDGSPWRAEAGRKLSVANANFKLSRQEKGQQLFINDTASAWNSGIITDLYVHGTWASGNGLPNVVTPHYSYQGTRQVESVTITGVNSDGSWETTSSTQNVTAMALCDGTPLSVEFVRAVSGPGK
ncbi:hypothetical protein Lsed01_00838 [Demequina sediminis]|uniref:Uncharacterized protein n=1 Tax=Demequina sediminis TaxID=1930058 RepID=A0ABP9WH24_9MICO|nr:hypothetical protein [Demequina sediminis]BDZ62507.1 hypothetical protein GCM10025873_22980 [Demequina sediminis]